MEHILQFGISIDDDAIKQRILDGGVNQIQKRLEVEVMKSLFETDYYGKVIGTPKDYLNEKINAAIEAHMDEIVDASAKIIADRFLRRKQTSKKLDEAVDSVL